MSRFKRKKGSVFKGIKNLAYNNNNKKKKNPEKLTVTSKLTTVHSFSCNCDDTLKGRSSAPEWPASELQTPAFL
jgi:hypothetical protein